MTYATLLHANLTRNPTRTLLTAMCLVIAFLLFGLLQPIAKIFREGPSNASTPRLLVTPKHSIVDLLPVSHREKIQQLDGVAAIAHTTWFGGTYVDPANFFPQYAVTPSDYLSVMEEIHLSPEQRTTFLTNRQGAIVGRETANRFGWKIGDRIPLTPNIWHNRDAGPWTFELVGIFDSANTSIVSNTGFYFSYAYFDAYRAFGNGTVGSFIVRAQDVDNTAELAKTVDSVFSNSNAETKTLSESEYALSFAKQVGDVGLIVSAILSAVFFTILLLAGNTIAQATRERMPEIAVMKVLGFGSPAVLGLMLAESVLLTMSAAALGMLLAQLLLTQLDTILPQLSQLGSISVTSDIAVIGLLIAALIGLVVGLPPAAKALRANLVDALRV